MVVSSENQMFYELLSGLHLGIDKRDTYEKVSKRGRVRSSIHQIVYKLKINMILALSKLYSLMISVVF